MGNLIGMAVRWVVRNLLSLVLIVAVLIAAGLIKKEIKEQLTMRDGIAALGQGKVFLESDINIKRKAFADRIQSFKAAGKVALDKRIAEVDQEIKTKVAMSKSESSMQRCVLMRGDACSKYLESVKVDADINLLEGEQYYLTDLRASINIGDGAKELERLRQEHIAIYTQYQKCSLDIQQFNKFAPATWLPGTTAHDQYQALKSEQSNLSIKNMQAKKSYDNQYKALDQIKTAKLKTKKWEDRTQTLLRPLSQGINSYKTIYQQKWLTKLLDSANNVMGTAIWILLGIILTPIGIKSFFYFIIAPLASRRAGICLLPEVSGEIEEITENIKGDFDRLKISEVSHSITINQTQELLLHPEYLQSSAIQGEKDTKWLLEWSYPLTSIAAGLFGLTRIRTGSTDTIVVSATKDPLSEVGVISIPEGSALVLQPHRLIGMIHSRNAAINISKHWRLGSLHAWLTLQLRYLVFHGPLKLVVKGCRGVRVEAADRGRSINQAATIGFTANLAYSTTRCETFGAYLMGKQELFNDNFSGGPGFYIYEEMPHGGQKTGLFGRGIEGLTDSLLKVLGV